MLKLKTDSFYVSERTDKYQYCFTNLLYLISQGTCQFYCLILFIVHFCFKFFQIFGILIVNNRNKLIKIIFSYIQFQNNTIYIFIC